MPEKKEHKKPKPNEGILVAAGWWKEDPERHRLESEGYMLPDLRQNKLQKKEEGDDVECI